jgi:hypothetical protein
VDARALIPLPLLLAGCLQGLPGAGPATTLAFTCAVLDPVQSDSVLVEAWTGSGAGEPWPGVAARVAAALAEATGRPGAFRAAVREGPPPPEEGWNRTTLQEWARGQDTLRQRVATLRLLWQPGEGNATGTLLSPGVVLLAPEPVRAAAERLGRPEREVAIAVALHHAGHALGLVNEGVPVQERDIQEREGPPGHDRDPASVFHAGWEDARTALWAANATYDRYPASAAADWRAARQPGGVCA